MTDEDKITRIDNTTLTRDELIERSKTYYEEKYQQNLTDICDFSEGSEIRTLHESIAIEIFNLYKDSYNMSLQKFVNYANGAYLDLLACEFHITRKSSKVASGNVTFTLNEPATAPYPIPRGTVILHRGTGYEFVLQQTVYIKTNTRSASGTVYSKITGSRYNSSANTLTAFKDIHILRTDLKVTNNNAITGGRDAETDEELRKRILDAKRTRAYGTVNSYTNIITSNVDDIHDLAFISPTTTGIPNHYQSDGKTKCTSCTRIIFVNAESKPCPQSTLEEVEYIMKQQKNLVIGHNFHIQRASITSIYLAVSIYYDKMIDADVMADHIEAFLDGNEIDGIKTTSSSSGSKRYTGMNIGQTLYKNRLISCIEDMEGVNQVDTIQQLKYTPTATDTTGGLPRDISGWTSNGDDTWNYIDSQGYVFTRSGTNVTTIDNWGRRSFDSISAGKGYVLSLGLIRNVDSSSDESIFLTQTKAK